MLSMYVRLLALYTICTMLIAKLLAFNNVYTTRKYQKAAKLLVFNNVYNAFSSGKLPVV